MYRCTHGALQATRSKGDWKRNFVRYCDSKPRMTVEIVPAQIQDRIVWKFSSTVPLAQPWTLEKSGGDLHYERLHQRRARTLETRRRSGCRRTNSPNRHRAEPPDRCVSLPHRHTEVQMSSTHTCDRVLWYMKGYVYKASKESRRWSSRHGQQRREAPHETWRGCDP
ncbi:hypothetical protein PybrP1_008582 [[Pythium] brassicae (nom. inval.)]|nr:hypothetical protein PybrP1_008582 [[Pythium] brassicae (nom. inval.)]